MRFSGINSWSTAAAGFLLARMRQATLFDFPHFARLNSHLPTRVMTGYTVHTGSSKKFAAGWDQVFKGQGQAKKTKAAAGAKPAAKEKKSK
jgi:hypothetical protein